MRVLDLFCGEGGAAKGYHDAGYEVFGIDTDHTRLKNYPYPCDSADAILYLCAHGWEYDLIHASPPCTAFSRGTAGIPGRYLKYDRLIAATRDALEGVGTPYIIENVADAAQEMRNPILLCGRMFGMYTHDTDGRLLVLDRHRLFESNLGLRAPRHPPHHRGKITVAGAYGGARRDRREAKHVRAGGYAPHPTIQKRLLGIDWMSNRGLELAIPPAYTRYLAKQVLDLTDRHGEGREQPDHRRDDPEDQG